MATLSKLLNKKRGFILPECTHVIDPYYLVADKLKRGRGSGRPFARMREGDIHRYQGKDLLL